MTSVLRSANGLCGSREEQYSVLCAGVGSRAARGGLALHNCGSQPDSSTTTRRTSNTRVRRGQRPVEVSSTMSQGVQCTDCGREFSRPSGLKRHKCLAERAKPIEEQRGSVQCEECRKCMVP